MTQPWQQKQQKQCTHAHAVCFPPHTHTHREKGEVSYLSHSAMSWHCLWISPSLGCAVICVMPLTVMPSRNTAPWKGMRGRKQRATDQTITHTLYHKHTHTHTLKTFQTAAPALLFVESASNASPLQSPRLHACCACCAGCIHFLMD